MGSVSLDSYMESYVPLLSQRDDTDEGSYFVPNAATASEVTSFIQDQSPKITDAQVATILTQYPLESNPTTAQHNEYFGVVSKAFGEVAFICSGIKLDTAYRNAGVPSWTYRSVSLITG